MNKSSWKSKTNNILSCFFLQNNVLIITVECSDIFSDMISFQIVKSDFHYCFQLI